MNLGIQIYQFHTCFIPYQYTVCPTDAPNHAFTRSDFIPWFLNKAKLRPLKIMKKSQTTMSWYMWSYWGYSVWYCDSKFCLCTVQKIKTRQCEQGSPCHISIKLCSKERHRSTGKNHQNKCQLLTAILGSSSTKEQTLSLQSGSMPPVQTQIH